MNNLSATAKKILHVMAFVFAFLGTVAVVHGCASKGAVSASTQPRDVARAAVVMASSALQTADQVCAQVASDTKDIALAGKCAAAYKTIRASLLTAAEAVDTWDALASSRESVTCAVLNSAAQLADLSRAISAKSGKALAPVDDFVTFAKGLGICADPSATVSVTVAVDAGSEGGK